MDGDPVICLACGGVVDGVSEEPFAARCECVTVVQEVGALACPSCGGHLQVEARACPFCSATLATRRCPDCTA
ncbi:MAG: hypothetical protein MUF54_07175, partial [Polyangiaceae bacterium]|nr:hypothetical protein [Polyangiaceae bacterium]